MLKKGASAVNALYFGSVMIGFLAVVWGDSSGNTTRWDRINARGKEKSRGDRKERKGTIAEVPNIITPNVDFDLSPLTRIVLQFSLSACNSPATRRWLQPCIDHCESFTSVKRSIRTVASKN